MLYVLESENNNIARILAVSSDLHNLDLHRDSLSSMSAKVNLIPLSQDFPLYAVEHREKIDDVQRVYYRYTPVGGLLALLENTPDQENGFDCAFSYYLFDQEYFSSAEDFSWIQPVRVDNAFLNGFRENESEEYLREQLLAAIVYDYNFAALDALFDHYVHHGNERQRRDLAENGYISLFHTMSYDLACNKLTQDGVALLLPTVEKAEALYQKKLWSLRAEALTNLLYNSVEHEPEKIVMYGIEAAEALKNEIAESSENSVELYQKLGYVYGELASYDASNQLEHWKQALDCIKRCVDLDPEQTRWEYYLKLVHNNIQHEHNVLKELRSVEARILLDAAARFAEGSLYHQLILAIAYRHYIEHNEEEISELPVMLEVQALYWLDLAISWNGDGGPSVTKAQGADFFKKEGVRLRRIDALEAAYALYPVTDIYHVTTVLQDMADLHIAQGNVAAANEALQKAWGHYREAWQDSDDNFSYLIQYATFLEKLYNTPYVSDKPRLQDIHYIATYAEKEGNGYYASPGFLLARLALLEDEDEEKAIDLVTRELLLHELCIDNYIVTFKENETFKAFYNLHAFLDETLQFMKDVSTNYYLDPSIPWSQLNTLTREEVADAWQQRMHAIRMRKAS